MTREMHAMNIKLKLKHRAYGLDKPGKAGGSRGHGSYTARTGNTHHQQKKIGKGTPHPIGFSGRATSLRPR